MADDEKPPRRRAPAKKAPAKRAPRKAAPKLPPEPPPTGKEQIASVTPIRGRRAGNRKGGADISTTPEGLKLHSRRTRAHQLRIRGLTWYQVADALKAADPTIPRTYDWRRAQEDVKAMVETVTIEAVQGIRETDLDTLMFAQRIVVAKVADGDLAAVDRLVRILERRSRYLGLDAPQRHVLTGEDGGPIRIDTADESAIYEAALAALDEALPHVPPPALPGQA